jgi:hypothetical protein
MFIEMSPPRVEFHREGCNSRVVLLGINAQPAHGLCVVCAFLREHVPDPTSGFELRNRIRRDLAGD